MNDVSNDISFNTIESALSGIQRLKSRIVTQISHEFRTPLTSIIGFASVLEENEQINESQRTEYARYIRNEGQRLAKVVNDLINLDALEHGQAHFLFESCEISKIVRHTVALVEEYAGSKSIKIVKELPNDPIILECDSERLIHALYQLLHNAIRFTKSGGEVIIKAEICDAFINISVQDNGPGIPPKDMPLLFKRFGKLYRPGEETHGTGVGLALAKFIVEQHGGDITIQSQVGEGSTFVIRLPLIS
jgi:two-component system, OmpR family, phosphate regulon sensor histidine kinase PhoR